MCYLEGRRCDLMCLNGLNMLTRREMLLRQNMAQRWVGSWQYPELGPVSLTTPAPSQRLSRKMSWNLRIRNVSLSVYV